MRAHQRKARQQAPEAFEGLPAPVFFGPRRWIGGEGAWASAARELAAWPGPLALVGETRLLGEFGPRLKAAWKGLGEPCWVELPDGADCCASSVAELRSRLRGIGALGLAGMGGGRVMDLCKLAAFAEDLPFAALPTSAATCACATAVAVLNDGAGGFLSVEDLGRSADLCAVETGILRAAPRRLLAAGLADTLAKWLEWAAIADAPEGFCASQAWELARWAAGVCERDGAAALADPSSAAFARCLEACLPASAAASCLGSAPAAAAHSLADALSRQPAGKTLLHGEAVGLGLLWQERLLGEGKRATIEQGRLAGLLEAWGLPIVLPPGLDLGRLALDSFAEGESVHALGLPPEPAAAARVFPGLP